VMAHNSDSVNSERPNGRLDGYATTRRSCG